MNDSGTSPPARLDPGPTFSDPPGADHPVSLVRATLPSLPDRRTAVAPAAEVRRLYERLADQPSLAPGPVVNALFHRLVELAIGLDTHTAADVLADPSVRATLPHLRRLCAEGETELERAWAARIATSSEPAAELHRFPYTENYRRLTDMEWGALAGAGCRRPRRIAFIGAGPLPLSAMLLARRGATVDSFDRDGDAISRARRLIDALRWKRIRFHHAGTDERPDLRRFDVVVLAALVGCTPAAKRTALRHVRAAMRPGALLVARSAHAARSLLYPVLDPAELSGFELLRVVHPFDQVINSVVLARRPADPTDPPRRATLPAPSDEVPPWPDS
jgi:nicotianamine synthase